MHRVGCGGCCNSIHVMNRMLEPAPVFSTGPSSVVRDGSTPDLERPRPGG